MNSEKMEHLKSGIFDRFREELGTLREHAEHFASQQVESMIERGDAIELSDDEIDMVKAYRRFDARSAPGSMFQWRTSPKESIVIPDEPSLLVHPREVVEYE